MADSMNVKYNNKEQILVIMPSDKQTITNLNPKVIIEKLEQDNQINVDEIISVEDIDNGEKIYYFKKRIRIGKYSKNDYELHKFSDYVTFGLLSQFYCIFEKRVDIVCCNFDNTIELSNCIFKEKLRIHTCNFYNGIKCINCKFEKDLFINGSIFYENVNFHNANFTNIPIFASVSFMDNQSVDFINSKIDSNNFNGIIQYINSNPAEKREELAIEIRDTYRSVKNALILQNNLLDASNWHKLELYAKEIELEYKNHNIFDKEWIDRWQLKFYHHLCDHHTNLLKTWHSLIALIGIFGFISTLIIYVFNSLYMHSNTLNIHINYTIYNLHIKHFIFNNQYSVIFINSILIALFVGVYCVYFKCKNSRTIIIILSYLISFIMLISTPKYIIPAISIFTDKRSILDPLSTIGAIYAILFALIVYSLAKTARKNSIVPS